MNINQFGMNTISGTLALTNGSSNVIACQLHSDSPVVPGEAVKLVDLATADTKGNPIVGKRTGANDEIFGTVVFSTKKSKFENGDIVEIALDTTVQYLTATSAIKRGSKVSADIANPGKVAEASEGQTILGIALDKAISANEVIRVLIKI